jgi:hypothetical protein
VLAQVSVEFIVFVSVLTVILLLTIYYNSTVYMEMNSAKIYNDAQGICDQIAFEINMALRAGDGYSRNFYIPYKISDSVNYNISLNNYLVVINWTGGSTQSIILTNNITANFTKGQNLIKNLNGSIRVN